MLDIGQEFSAERTFTAAMVDAFTAISLDHGRHHTTSATDARIVHGLLVATLATEIGGRLDFLARTLDFEFLRPVYVGDTIRCTARIDRMESAEDRTRLWLSALCVNQRGVEVMRVTARGVVFKPRQ